MTKDEALSKLELEEGATTSEINAQYQEFYNEFQMRITNAPTEHQRKLYQKKLEELSEAFKVLGGENSESNTQELPGIAESDIVVTEKRIDSSVSNPIEISKEKALQILGLGEKFTEIELNKAFQVKVEDFEKGRDNAVNDVIRSAYAESLIECKESREILKTFVFVPEPAPVPVAAPAPAPVPKAKVSPVKTQVVKTESKPASKKKWLLPVSIVGGVIIVVILYFAFGKVGSNTDEISDPTVDVEYVKLKTEADLLAEQGNWQDALDKYEAVYLLAETSEVKDSIESMKKHLLLASIEKKDGSDEQKQEANIDKDNEAAVFKKEKELGARENALKEAERLRQEKGSTRIKIGDNYAGGIVFKIDASGEHGLVCAPKDQGKFEWEEAKSACQNLTLNGYSDWYLPSKDQLNSMYINIGRGSSIGNVGGFASDFYWSSTEYDNYNAWFQNFSFGSQYFNNMGSGSYVRAVRAF